MKERRILRHRIEDSWDNGAWAQCSELCRELLTAISPKEKPKEWLAYHLRLAYCLTQNEDSGRVERLREAIEIYQRLLSENETHLSPAMWAGLHLGLGNSYHDKEIRDIEKCLYHYEEALKVFSKQESPEDWAMTRAGIGLAYAHRSRGRRPDNISLAIENYRATLEVYTSGDYPEDRQDSLENIAYLSKMLEELGTDT